ncbi:MAG: arsinothricin resistance N-acetyltransferase ArsN1 family B [Chloroflexota bacterium]
MTTIIRLARQDDATQVLGIYAPIVEKLATSFELEPPDAAEMQQRIGETLVQWPWLVCERAGAVLGYAYASQHRARPAYRWSVDVSVYIHADARRMGLGRALYTSLFEILSLQGYFNAYAGIALPNPGSVGLHEALGFKAVGVYHQVGYKLGAWHDVGWWQLALQPKAPAPEAPKGLADVQQAGGWKAAFAAGEALLKA